jgi:hypothetical protein
LPRKRCPSIPPRCGAAASAGLGLPSSIATSISFIGQLRDLKHAECCVSHPFRLRASPASWPVAVHLCTLRSHPTPKGGHQSGAHPQHTHPASMLASWRAAAGSDKTSIASRSSWGESLKRQRKRVRLSRPSACRSQSSLSRLIEEAKCVDAQTCFDCVNPSHYSTVSLPRAACTMLSPSFTASRPIDASCSLDDDRRSTAEASRCTSSLSRRLTMRQTRGKSRLSASRISSNSTLRSCRSEPRFLSRNNTKTAVPRTPHQIAPTLTPCRNLHSQRLPNPRPLIISNPPFQTLAPCVQNRIERV